MAMKRFEVGAWDSVWYGIIVLLGELNVDWEYYETDETWWQVKLTMRRN